MDMTSSSLASSAAGSLSQSSLSSSVDTAALDIDMDVMDCLVQDVKNLSDALNKLNVQLLVDHGAKAFEQIDGGSAPAATTEQKCVEIHRSLSDVTKVLKDLTNRYVFLQCSEVLNPTSALIHAIKGLNFDSPTSNSSESFVKARSSVEKLQFAVAECVGEYLTWEMAQYESAVSKLSQSSEELSGSVSTPIHSSRIPNRRPGVLQRRHSTFQTKSGQECATSEEIDKVLQRMENGVELAFSRAKAWSKYSKEILNFVHRRINLESEHAKNVQKLAETTKLSIQDDNYLPLKNIYMSSFKIEHEFFDNCMDTMKRLYEYKYIKPLEARKTEHDSKRKELRLLWERQIRQVNDVRMELRKAKQNHAARESNYRKARESSIKLELNSASEKAKIEKRRKLEEDAMIKSKQAAQECSILEDKFEKRCQEMERAKVKILADIRELIYQCDQTSKACTVAYFQALAGLWAPLPMQYQSLSESTRDYVPGVEYLQFVQQLPYEPDVSKFTSFRTNRANSDEQLPVIQVNGHPVKSTKKSMSETISYPGVTSSSVYDSGDDTSISSYTEASTGYKSPPIRGKSEKQMRRFSALSEAARSHRLQKVRLPTKCCQCDAYTFFQTIQCSECTEEPGPFSINNALHVHYITSWLASKTRSVIDRKWLDFSAALYTDKCGMNWHKECLSLLETFCGDSSKCSLNMGVRKMSIFGVPLMRHLQDTESLVPEVLHKCINELETRGLTVKGLYRVCGVKTKIEELCEQFEREDVDLSGIHPTNIASVVKLYLRQLPEPVLTHQLYPEFIKIAKDFPAERTGSPDVTSAESRVKSVIQRLPSQNFETAKALILHLNRLTWFESENQMTASNLGIVFGPTILWKEDGKAGPSLNSLIETPVQTRAVELLIDYAYEIFDTDPSPDMLRLGVLRRPPIREKRRHNHGRSFHVSNPFTTSYPCGMEAIIPEEPRRTTATPDILKHRSPVTSSSHGSLEFLDLSDNSHYQSGFSEKDLNDNAKNGFGDVNHKTVIPIFDSSPTIDNGSIIPFQRNRPLVRRTPSKKSTLVVNSEPNVDRDQQDCASSSFVTSSPVSPEPRSRRALTDPEVHGHCRMVKSNEETSDQLSPNFKKALGSVGILFGISNDDLAYV